MWANFHSLSSSAFKLSCKKETEKLKPQKKERKIKMNQQNENKKDDPFGSLLDSFLKSNLASNSKGNYVPLDDTFTTTTLSVQAPSHTKDNSILELLPKNGDFVFGVGNGTCMFQKVSNAEGTLIQAAADDHDISSRKVASLNLSTDHINPSSNSGDHHSDDSDDVDSPCWKGTGGAFSSNKDPYTQNFYMAHPLVSERDTNLSESTILKDPELKAFNINPYLQSFSADHVSKAFNMDTNIQEEDPGLNTFNIDHCFKSISADNVSEISMMDSYFKSIISEDPGLKTTFNMDPYFKSISADMDTYFKSMTSEDPAGLEAFKKDPYLESIYVSKTVNKDTTYFQSISELNLFNMDQSTSRDRDHVAKAFNIKSVPEDNFGQNAFDINPYFKSFSGN